MVQQVKAFGQILQFPDEMSEDAMAEAIRSNEPDLNPDYKAPEPEALDYAKGFASGANKLVSGVGYLAEAAGAKDTGKAIREFGDRGAAYWNEQMSPGGKKAAESQVFVDDPESITGLRLGDDAGKALLMGAAQSLPSMFAAALPGVAITKGIQALASLGLAGGAGATIPLLAGTAAPVGIGSQVIARVPSAVGFGAAEGVVSGGMNAAGLKSSIEGMSDKELLKSPVYQALRAQHGEEKARTMLADQAASDLFGKTSVSTGAIGALTGGGALGSAYQKVTSGAADGILMTGLKGAGQEAIQETPQSGGEKYIENITRKEYLDPSIDPMSGVIAEAASGGAIGAFTGGIVGAGSAVNLTKQAEVKAQEINAAKINPIHEAATVDEAIVAANEAVKGKPVTKEDVLRTVDPTLADIEALTGVKPNETQATIDTGQAQAAEVLDSDPNKTIIVMPDGTRLDAVWDIVDADQVSASISKGVNQPRDRKRAAANVQVQEIANAPDYLRLKDSPVMDAGAPTLSLNNKIVGGNGRFEGVSLAYDQGTAGKYVESLRADAITKGVDPTLIDRAGKPILIRRLVNDHNIRKLAIRSNSGLSLDMSPIELASVDAERMVGVENLQLNDLGEVALTPANVTTLKDVFADYNSGEMNSMADKHLNLSQSGRARIRNAMLAKAYGDSPTLEKLIESTDNDMRNVLGALVKSVGHVLKSKQDTKALLEAVDTYSQLKATGQPVDNFLAQQDAFSEGLSKEAESILRFIETNVRSQKKLTDFIKGNFREVDTTSADMFNQEAPKDERISNLEKHLKNNGYDFTVEPASVRDVDALDSTKKARKELAEKQAKLFKKKVVFVKADGPFSINGVMVPNIADTIFVDIRTAKPFDAIMAHELSHWMEQEKPAVYKQMVKSLKQVIKDDATGKYAKKYGINGATKADLTKEIVGDIMGDNFTEQSFWDKVAAANPEAFKDIAAAIIKWLKGIIVKAKANGMGSEEWVKDATKAQDIIAKAVAQYTGESKAAGAEGGVKFHKAFHGSPHDHNKFDTSKIGTGEGAQAYGYGHYFAESKDVAEYYKEALEPSSEIRNLRFGSVNLIKNEEYQDYSPRDSSPLQQAKALLSEDVLIREQDVIAAYDKDGIVGAKKVMLEIADDRIDTAKQEQPDIVGHLKVLKDRIQNDLKLDVKQYKGKLYEVELAPEQDEYLLWDKPLSEQSDKVKAALIDNGLYEVLGDKEEKFANEYAAEVAKLGGNAKAVKDSILALSRNKEMTDDLWNTLLSNPQPEGFDLNNIHDIFRPQYWESNVSRVTGEHSYYSIERTGEQLYRDVTKENDSPVLASEYLHSLGIRGIKYLDGSSRAKGEGAYNYVIFDDKDVSITAKFSRAPKKLDAEYMDAVNSGDMEKAQQMVDSAAREKGYISGNEYRMMHQAPNRDDYNLATIKNAGIVPDDYWTHPQYYQNDYEERTSFYQVKAAIDSRKQRMFVFRSVPKSVKDDFIRNGDWVSPSRAYAKLEGESIPGGYRIIAQRVDLKDLWWDANSINELGYDDGKEYAHKNTKNNRKLLDAVTYDDDGNAIPLSKRFNSRKSEVKFSKTEIDNTLIAQHNLSVRNLIHADRMGGLAAPSIAVTDKAHPLTGFGEITLLSNKDLIDPKNGTKIFGSDIYSPRYPSISYDFSGKPIKALNALLAKGVAATGDSEYYNDNLQNDPFRELTHSSAAMYTFLSEQGVEPELAYVKVKELPIDSLKPFADGTLDSFDMSKDEGFRKSVKDYWAEKFDGEILGNDELINLARAYSHDVIAYRDSKKNVGKIDRQATNTKLFRQISDANLRNKFDEYLVDLVNRAGPKERIFKGYTNAGNRQYMPHDIDTVIKILKKDLRGGENFKYGLGSIRAKYSPQFKSIEQIRKSKGMLMNSESFDQVKKEVQAGLDGLNESLASYGTFSGYDNVETMLSDAAKRGISGALKDNGFENVPDSIKVDIQTFLNKLKDMPTEYFEAKILRAVGLGEFSTAVIPDDSTPQVESILKKNGIEDIRKYKSGDNEDRVKQINKVTHVMFSRAPKLYSKLEQALEAASDKVFSTGPQVKLWLQSNAGKLGIKKDEIYWSGIDNWLDAQGKVSKQQVVEFVRNNGVQVEDVTLGKITADKDRIDELHTQLADILKSKRELDNKLEFGMITPQEYDDGVRSSINERRAIEDELDQSIPRETLPKHNNANLTLPGGTDYKELVVTVPTIEPHNADDSTHFGDTGQGKQIGWLRMDTRDGGLFIEELQSQRAQQGRSKGFGPRNVTRYEVILNGKYWGDFNTKLEADTAVKSASTAAGDFEVNEVVTGRLRGVPPAPFVSDSNQKATNAYITLLMKKALIEAVSNDHASVSWTTGDQQADRYDLSKQVDTIEYRKSNDGTYQIAAIKDDTEVTRQSQVDENKLADVVGKDVAHKIVAGEGSVGKQGYRRLSGLDLKTGGEWAQSMYGNEQGLNLQGKPSLMSQAANDIFKHVGSGKVESINGQPGFYVTPEMKSKDLPLFSKEPSKPTPPDESRLRRFQRMNQDSFNRFTVIKEWLAENGQTLSDKADVYGAEERYHSMAANQLEDFREQQRNPLIEKIQKAGYTLGDIEVFLKMQHTPEANAANQKLTGNPESTAAGISDEDANEYLAEAPENLATLANELRDITEQTKQLRLDAGILNTDITGAWENTYKFYVPMKGEADSTRGVGKGLKTNFKSKRRLGHSLRDEHVIENILMDHERAILEVERNRVGKHLVMMAAEMQRPDILSIDQPEKRKMLKESTAYTVEANGVVQGVFKSREEAKMFKQFYAASMPKVAPSAIVINQTKDQRVIASASPMLAENEVNVYMNGHAIRVQINDELLARAYTKMGVEQFSDIVGAGRILNGYLSKVYTGYNPEFILTNMIRDFSSGTINLTGEQGFGMATKALTNYPRMFTDLLKYATTNGKSSTKWIDAYRKNGGNTGAAYLSDMERLGNEVNTEYASYQGVLSNLKQGDNANAARAAGRKVFNATLKWIYNLNQAGENAMRLAAFKAMIDSGRTVNEAAKVAKNITVNFNRKGERQWAPALYLFYNASVQGTAATAHALTKGKHKGQAWALAGSMAAVGYMMAASFGGGDEDDWDEINEYTKERNMLIKSGDGYVKVPVPYGYGFFWNFGRHIAEAQRTGELGTMPWHLATSAISEFTPFNEIVVGSDEEFRSDQVFMGLLPTAMKIVAQPTFNKQLFTGSELMPESERDKSQPDRQKMFRGTKGTMYDTVAGWLDSAGIDVSPETLKYITRTGTGGAGSLVDTSISAVMLKAEGAELDTQEIPFVRKAYMELGIKDKRAAYYNVREEARTAAEEFNRARRDNDVAKMQDVLKDKKELIALDRYANKLAAVIDAARDQQDAVRADKNLSVQEKRLKLKDMEATEAKFYDQYLDVFKATRRP